VGVEKKGNPREKKVVQTATARKNIFSNHFFPDELLSHSYLSDEEWEKDLAAEIQDFEVVDDNVDSDLEDLK
jgi:hypothetical protein